MDFVTRMSIMEDVTTVRHGIDEITYNILLGKLEGIDNLGEIKVDV